VTTKPGQLQQPRQHRQQDTVPVAQIQTMDLTAQDTDLMPEREDLQLPAPISTHHQEQEPKDVTKDEAEEGPEHKQPR
jgi:hypothetical protein